MTRPPNPDLDRCAGVLLGLAAGDALGAGYEFRTPPRGDAAMIGGGLGGWEVGEWTDDTQMAVCIAEKPPPATSTRPPSQAASSTGTALRSGRRRHPDLRCAVTGEDGR
jgi:hypothetical protein